MKSQILFLSLIAAFAGSAFAVPYDSAWHQADFWSGEYPNGVAVIQQNLTVQGRMDMDKDAPANVTCALPYKANFHPWNQTRTETSQVTYRTASKIVPLIAKEDFELGEQQAMKVSKGDVIEYLIYHSEGWFAVRYKGLEYEADDSLFEKVEEVSQDQFVQDEWMYLTCENGAKTWLYLPGLQTAEGEWLPGLRGPKIEGYGEASDLTDKDLEP